MNHPSKRIISILATSLLLMTSAQADKYLTTASKQKKITPKQALQLLKEGNQRFVTNNVRDYDFIELSKESSKGQYPFAVVLGCLDSRSAPDYTFDQGLGNIFIARTAGNVVGKDVLGSMEFATKFAGAKLIVVVGHTRCGAVIGACNNVKAGNLTQLLAKIQPAVATAKAKHPKNFACNNHIDIEAAAKQNVINQLHTILRQSPIIKKLVKNNTIMLVGAMHNLEKRTVVFFDKDGKNL